MLQKIRAIQFLILASVVALATAYIAEYAFNLKPCHLCLFQRIPYALVMVLAGVGFMTRHKPPFFTAVLWGCILLFIVEVGLAGYHTGVEYGVFKGLEGCSSGDIPEGGLSLEALRQQILTSEVVRCDQPSFVFLGISMAGWNTLYAFLSLVLTALILTRKNKQ